MLTFDLDHSYGECAKVIYENLCTKYRWNAIYSKDFTYGKLFFAPYATRKGLSVWFLAHNNWTKTNNGMWQNEIFLEKGELVESYPVDKSYYSDQTDRVVFTKNSDGCYVFLGVYKFHSTKQTVWKSDFRSNDGKLIAPKGTEKRETIFIRISDTYPMVEVDDPYPDLIQGHLWSKAEYTTIFEGFLREYVLEPHPTRSVNLFRFAQSQRCIDLAFRIGYNSFSDVARMIKGIVEDLGIPNNAPFFRLDTHSDKLREVSYELIAKYNLLDKTKRQLTFRAPDPNDLRLRPR